MGQSQIFELLLLKLVNRFFFFFRGIFISFFQLLDFFPHCFTLLLSFGRARRMGFLFSFFCSKSVLPNREYNFWVCFRFVFMRRMYKLEDVGYFFIKFNPFFAVFFRPIHSFFPSFFHFRFWSFTCCSWRFFLTVFLLVCPQFSYTTSYSIFFLLSIVRFFSPSRVIPFFPLFLCF